MAVRYENLTETISVRISKRMLEELQERSRRMRLPVTALHRMALDEFLERQDLAEAKRALEKAR